MLNMLIQSVDSYFADNPQPYLVCLYKALLSTTYYGLFRIGEVTQSDHVIKAKDVQRGQNKNKLMFTLYTWKTHGEESCPQTVKISELKTGKDKSLCPFAIFQDYIEQRETYSKNSEQLFVFRDQSPVKPEHFRTFLKELIRFNHMDPSRYRVHELCSGHSTDLLEANVPIDVIKWLGRWKSSAVFRYLKA